MIKSISSSRKKVNIAVLLNYSPKCFGNASSDLLKKAEGEFLEAKKEYDTILVESRDPDFKIEYGVEKVPSDLLTVYYVYYINGMLKSWRLRRIWPKKN